MDELHAAVVLLRGECVAGANAPDVERKLTLWKRRLESAPGLTTVYRVGEEMHTSARLTRAARRDGVSESFCDLPGASNALLAVIESLGLKLQDYATRPGTPNPPPHYDDAYFDAVMRDAAARDDLEG